MYFVFALCSQKYNLNWLGLGGSNRFANEWNRTVTLLSLFMSCSVFFLCRREMRCDFLSFILRLYFVVGWARVWLLPMAGLGNGEWGIELEVEWEWECEQRTKQTTNQPKKCFFFQKKIFYLLNIYQN